MVYSILFQYITKSWSIAHICVKREKTKQKLSPTRNELVFKSTFTSSHSNSLSENNGSYVRTCISYPHTVRLKIWIHDLPADAGHLLMCWEDLHLFAFLFSFVHFPTAQAKYHITNKQILHMQIFSLQSFLYSNMNWLSLNGLWPASVRFYAQRCRAEVWMKQMQIPVKGLQPNIKYLNTVATCVSSFPCQSVCVCPTCAPGCFPSAGAGSWAK